METINSGHNAAVVIAQNLRGGLAPLETGNSDKISAVLYAQNHRWGRDQYTIIIRDLKQAVLHSQMNRWSLGPMETCNSDPKVVDLQAKTTDEGWDS